MPPPRLVTFYTRLPQPQHGDDPDLLQAGMLAGMREFADAVTAVYTESTLQRLLNAPDTASRRAAALAIGLVGSMQSNAALAGALRDTDTLVRKFATDSLWELWFRAGTADQNSRLQRALQHAELGQSVAALDALIREAPGFAEAYNQRAIISYRRGDYGLAVRDCEAVLRLNPHHFGAAAGMGQCFLRLHKPRAALRAFRQAMEINPSTENVRDTIRGLESALDDATRDDG